MKKHITGIGGIFFKAADPTSLKKWYQDHLGIDAGEYGATFTWRDADDVNRECRTVWSPFPHDTTYFEPSTASFMINYIVEDLDALLADLQAKGFPMENRIEDTDYGRFTWISDPEGNRLELWEPPKGKLSPVPKHA
jgi:predicted enzyme related to lactoylglutathione lyase